MPEVGVARRGRAAGGLAVVAVAALAVAMVALVYANTSSEWPGSVLMSEGQRTTKLAWGGFTNQMQEEADKALRLCKVGLLGKKQHCATHLVSTDFTKRTHTDSGQPTREESQSVLSQQVPCAPLLERASWQASRADVQLERLRPCCTPEDHAFAHRRLDAVAPVPQLPAACAQLLPSSTCVPMLCAVCASAFRRAFLPACSHSDLHARTADERHPVRPRHWYAGRFRRQAIDAR